MFVVTRFSVVLLLLSLFSGCSTLGQDVSQQQLKDPFESFNRKVYAFNQGADKLVLKPIAKGYDKVLPGSAKSAIGRFFNNLDEPLNALNNVLQGKYDRALVSTYRFSVNSTLGLLGVFDIAKKHDVYDADEDFGQTLSAWGVKPGPYLMLPFFGPSNFRDGAGDLVDRFILNPFDEITNRSSDEVTLFGLSVIHTRHSLIGADDVLESQLDPYSFLKNAYQQDRIIDIYDDAPPVAESEDFNDF